MPTEDEYRDAVKKNFEENKDDLEDREKDQGTKDRRDATGYDDRGRKTGH